jgi:hypothetical protein
MNPWTNLIHVDCISRIERQRKAKVFCAVNDVTCATLSQAGLSEALFWIAVPWSNEVETVDTVLRVGRVVGKIG